MKVRINDDLVVSLPVFIGGASALLVVLAGCAIAALIYVA